VGVSGSGVQSFLTDNILLHSRDIHDQVVKLSKIMPKLCFGLPDFLSVGFPKSLPYTYKSQPAIIEHSLVLIDQATSDIWWQKRKIKNKM